MSQSLKTKNGTPTRSDQKRLSDVARYVNIPAGIVSTGFPGVRDRCRQFGVRFDRWQEGIGRLALSKRADGQYAAGIGGVVLSIARQTGKTFLIGWILFALATIFPSLTIVWTAHHTRTSDETFEKMRTMSRKPKVAPYVDVVRAANGKQAILFKNGSRIMFGAREQGFGRGFDKVDVLVLDEAQILTESALSDMTPATNAAPNGLVFMMGTPPRPKDPGEAFGARREDAIEKHDDDTLYVELSADENAKIIDWGQIAKANPSYPHRTSRTAILRMQKLVGSDENFRREAYGIWDKQVAGQLAFPKGRWERLRADIGDCVKTAYGVKFTADGAGVALVAAFLNSDGSVFVEPIKQANLGEGIQWLVDDLVELAPYAAQIVIDGKSGVGYLVNALRDAGVKNKRLIILPTLDQVIAAHSMFEQEFIKGTVSHGGDSELARQVEYAKKRKIGNNGGFGYEAPEGETVVSLDAALLAVWGVKTTKRKPGKGSKVSV